MSQWTISNDSIYALEELQKLLLVFAKLAKSGNDLIGIGETVKAIECIINNDDYDFINVGLTVGFRRSSEGLSEGLFYGLRINDEEFSLDKLNIQNAGYGTDHWTEDLFAARKNRPLDATDILKWIENVNAILNFDDEIQLSVSRDHI